MTKDPRLRTVVRRVRAIDCDLHRVTVHNAIFDEIEINGLRSTSGVFVWAAAFRHVTVRGKISGAVKLDPLVGATRVTPAEQRAFDEANARYYETVDCALDIRDAEFREVQLTGVPASLVRRDPAISVVVRRERAQTGLHRRLDLSGTWWDIALDDLARGRCEDQVLVAPRLHKRFPALLAGLKRLLEAGIAEPQ